MEEETARASTSPTLEENLYRDSGYASLNGIGAKIEAMAGSSGFMLFSTSNHGTLLRIVGQQRKAVQYVVGNPLFAVEMTRHAIARACTPRCAC